MAIHRGDPILMEALELRARGAVHPILAWAGIAAPVIFTAVFLIQEAFRREEYDPLAEPVSALEAGPAGWIQQVNFVIFGLLTITHAIAQHAGMLATRRGMAGPLLLAGTGIGSLVSGFFPIREDPAGVTEIPVGHLVGGLTFFLVSPLALIFLSGRMRRDPAWHSLARYTLVSGLVLVALDIVTLALVFPDDGPLHNWAGLIQRITILAVLFPCRIILAVRLLTMAGDQRRRRTRGGQARAARPWTLARPGAADKGLPLAFATLTAPSFVPVQTARKPGRPSLRMTIRRWTAALRTWPPTVIVEHRPVDRGGGSIGRFCGPGDSSL